VTNYHVVEGSSQVLVKHLDVTLPAQIVAVDRENDIALLKTPKGDKPFSYMSVNSAALPSPGSNVFTVGFPSYCLGSDSENDYRKRDRVCGHQG
jgi:S1-C subfamily serine protease